MTADGDDVPRLAIGLPVARQVYGPGEHAQILDMARAADEAGIDTLVATDHVVMGERFDRYPFGPFRFSYGDPWLEPLTTLAAIAGATRRVRISTGVLIAALRRAPLLAKTAATLDVLSGGRLELGVGTGWQPEEYETMGLDFDRRARLLDDTVAACRALWTPGATTFASETISFDRIWCDPQPTRPGGPPILFGGPLTKRNVRRVVELGDGWIPIMGEPADGVAAGTARLREALAEAGDPDRPLRVRHSPPVVRHNGTADLDRTLDGAGALLEAGATEILLPLGAFVSEAKEAPSWVTELGRRWARLW
ncbi:LLM class F420-dependent oxidoreductase [Actinomadura sp. NBRC 104412]|uniref:TIGR03619 family F420-dependent LLM class oxidoreductase n=1 Tax=Actinomadura sp. NBRC 104412 TaxID=3032203 RepID=UPI0024A4EA40|nr:TIGR03619 family F420-dependent LLM class oxidoreductase [Actinomadura sp. NBRC 104412]GLZ03121.1 LLM class F420-dependent oxidoreductase [Actinomadura sp. NBRC 104412]